jgi:hypothetical protein
MATASNLLSGRNSLQIRLFLAVARPGWAELDAGFSDFQEAPRLSP